MKNLITTSLLLLSSFISFSQNIIGKIVDDSEKGIYYATVALYIAADSTFQEAEFTDENGEFKFDNLNDGKYYLEINMLGYQDNLISDISIPNQKENLVITLDTDANILSTIEIKDRMPLLEQKADKLIVNVADNITNTSGSLLDVMKKVPGMIVINDRLTMAGSGTPTILLNGKSTQYVDMDALLRDMPGDNIKKVEIIHQPGAEYEAAGSGPIINIILKKNSLFGTNGSVTLGVGRGNELWDYTTGLNLSHYAGRINITGGLGYAKNAYYEEINLNRRLTTISDNLNGTYAQTNKDAAQPKSYRGNIRVDWDATDKHRIGIESKYYTSDNQRIATNITNVDLSNPTLQDYRLNTDNDINRSWTYTSINPYYIFEIDTSGQKIEYDVNFARYDREGINTLTTINNIDNSIQAQRYTQPGVNNIFATSLDYTKPLNKVFELRTGLKYSDADLDNDLKSEFSVGNNEWVNNEQQSNHYLFGETIYAAYTKLSFSSGDWSGTAGLRYEKSKSVGESLTLDSTLTRDISKLFPSFSISKKLGSILTSTVSYSYRIDRPRYSTLNPFVYYLDPFTFEQGNPNIRPELTHSAKFTLSYEGQPFFNVEYKKSNNAIVEVTTQEPDSQEASKTDVNFDNQTILSASLFFPLDFIPGVSSGYGGVIVTDNKYNSVFNEGNFDQGKFNTTLFISAEIDLPLDINAELGGWYTSGSQEGIFQSEYLYGTSFALSKKFMDNKAKISFGIEDFANKFWNARVDYQQDMDLTVKWQAPVVNMRLSYKFGNQHLKSKGKRKGSASEEINRASQGN